MNRNNVFVLSRKSGRNKDAGMVEKLISIDILLGAFMIYTPLKYLRYLLSLAIQSYLLVKVLAMNKYGKKATKATVRYLFTMMAIGLISIVFLFLDVKPTDAINRILPLIAIFGFIIIAEERLKLNINLIVFTFVRLYVFLAFIMNVNNIVYLACGKAIWVPIHWLGLRYAGPFADSNFTALFSAAVFLTVWYADDIKSTTKWFYLFHLGINILFAGALSTYLLLPCSMLITCMWKTGNNIKKQVVILAVYAILLYLYWKFNVQFQESVTGILYRIYHSVQGARAKYISLQWRLDTQVKAMKIFFEEWWGQGPRQIAPQLVHDTHNSYVAILFEQGIVGFFLILLTLSGSAQSKASKYVGTYLMLSALLLNVHYMSIYTLFILIQYKKEDNRAIKAKG